MGHVVPRDPNSYGTGETGSSVMDGAARACSGRPQGAPRRRAPRAVFVRQILWLSEDRATARGKPAPVADRLTLAAIASRWTNGARIRARRQEGSKVPALASGYCRAGSGMVVWRSTGISHAKRADDNGGSFRA